MEGTEAFDQTHTVMHTCKNTQTNSLNSSLKYTRRHTHTQTLSKHTHTDTDTHTAKTHTHTHKLPHRCIHTWLRVRSLKLELKCTHVILITATSMLSSTVLKQTHGLMKWWGWGGVSVS